MNIIGHRKIFFITSGVLFLVSVLVVALWGLRLGIDFTGGSILEVEYAASRPDTSALKAEIDSAGLNGLLFSSTGERGLFVRAGHLSEDDHQKLLMLLAGKKGENPLVEKRFDSIGPTIGKELKNRSVLAIILVILLIVLYIAWAFRKVSKPVPSWKYGVVTVVALLHDVFLPLGFFVIIGHFAGAEVDTLFVTALLTILGFSVHDTIVVFDRIRENLNSAKAKESFEETVNKSVNETMVRSINTSFTVILAMSAVLLLGGESVRYFSLTLIAGIIFGTYSSIFIASPLLVSWHYYTFGKSAGN
ncbi:MAG: protein translocase subunit SecF [bacterium]|nr:protein translocase subunit SecF [bacterium]